MLVETQTKTWQEHYKGRINSVEYEKYFADRYAVMLETIYHDIRPHSVVEEGIGIGSIGKEVLRLHPEILYTGYDINEEMLNLTHKNCSSLMIWCDDIHNPRESYSAADLMVTHGVIEHFSDEQIVNIMDRYKRNKLLSIHYVPLDKYLIPSFGDERLLPYQHWLELVKPQEYKLFNDNHDLMFIV